MADVSVCPHCAGPVLKGQRACSLCGGSLSPAPRRAPAPPAVDEAEARRRAPNCYDCAHFMLTHQPGRSRACTVFGFKCDEMPSYVVFNVTGKECIYFEKRAEG